MSEESIFETTIRKRNPAERDVFPGGACGGNAKVRRHDETLARARQQSRGLPDSSANGAGSSTAAVEVPRSLEQALDPVGRALCKSPEWHGPDCGRSTS